MNCVANNCDNSARFGLPGSRPKFCNIHKTTKCINLYKRKSGELIDDLSIIKIKKSRKDTDIIYTGYSSKSDDVSTGSAGSSKSASPIMLDDPDIFEKLRCDKPVIDLTGNNVTQRPDKAPDSYVKLAKVRFECHKEGCDKDAKYGVLGKYPIRCPKHKSKHRHDNLNRRCKYPECANIATYGLPHGDKTFCYKHYPNGCINLSGNKNVNIDNVIEYRIKRTITDNVRLNTNVRLNKTAPITRYIDNMCLIGGCNKLKKKNDYYCEKHTNKYKSKFIN